jgi:glutamate formiminotransferase / 5-formyltetrahydrofolate cyclo-ligase
VTGRVLASAVNVSEGKDARALDALAEACGDVLLDVHRDPDHHRSVLTLGGPDTVLVAGVRSLIELAVRSLDLGRHVGVHPRFGVVDVVPFAPVGSDDLVPAIAARDAIAIWAGGALGVPCFLYGPMPDGGERSLPEVRRGAFVTLVPDTGPDRAHASAGAMAVGARGPLVAYNLWVEGLTPAETRAVALRVRSRVVRTLGFSLGSATQVSCNLVQPERVGPAEVYDLVRAALPAAARITRGELVGLLPASVLARVPAERYEELGLSPADVLEARLADPSLRKRRS